MRRTNGDVGPLIGPRARGAGPTRQRPPRSEWPNSTPVFPYVFGPATSSVLQAAVITT
jgi:hypothetical protein